MKKVVIYGNNVNALSDAKLIEAVRLALNMSEDTVVDIDRMREDEELELIHPPAGCNSYYALMNMLLARVCNVDTVLMSPRFSLDKGLVDEWFMDEISCTT